MGHAVGEMSASDETLRIERVAPASLHAELVKLAVFAELSENTLGCLGPLQVVHAPAGAVIFSSDGTQRAFWALLEGEARLVKSEHGLHERMPALTITLTTGETFGELPILAGTDSAYTITATAASRLVRFDEEEFWQLMFSCPKVRGAVLGNVARRLQGYQAQTLHREKLASLGTLAAGLMHELNNPGAAALRAASQMRENLSRLQQTSLSLARTSKTPEQLQCMVGLQEQALSAKCCRPMGTLEQSDAEETLAAWLEEAGVENSWQLSPTLIAIGLDQAQLECARDAFSGAALSDMLNWLVSLISSAQLVSTIEESLARVSDLVLAVKTYAYEGKTGPQTINVHTSIQSTLVILAHKLKGKGITVQKDFAPNLPLLLVTSPGLNQVWTNLIDNAIDASPEGGTIRIRTTAEPEHLVVAILDHGPGIPEQDRARVFEPFFTTKEAGCGTGLGLEIVRRIVVTQMGGAVDLESQPGATEFTVRLPLTNKS